jgi:hemophore-related protein
MLLFGRAVTAVIGTGVLAGVMLFGGASSAFAQPPPTPSPSPAGPPPPGCTAGDMARVSAGVDLATADYLFSHPDVNNFFTSLHGLPTGEIRGDEQNYLNADPQTQSDLTAIRQPLTDLRARCE